MPDLRAMELLVLLLMLTSGLVAATFLALRLRRSGRDPNRRD